MKTILKPAVYFYRLVKTLWLKPYAVNEFLLHLRKKGLLTTLKETLHFLKHKANKGCYSYKLDAEPETIKAEIASFPTQPKFSVLIPVYNTEVKWLKQCIASVQNQLYDNWEICIADDCSNSQPTISYLHSLNSDNIQCSFLTENQGIVAASNAAAALATGDYIILLDHDDELTPDCLFEIAKMIHNTKADLIYSDEDFIDCKNRYHSPHFKPDYSPQLLFGHNYITHLVAIKQELFEQIGKFRSGYDGAQDYDLLLRATEQAQCIKHIPKVLYHWRMHAQSTSLNPASKSYANTNGLKALEDAIKRRQLQADVSLTETMFFYRVHYKLIHKPLVSIIIPVKDQAALLRTCINSILTKSTYHNYEIIIINNNSEKQETFGLLKELTSSNHNIHVHNYDKPFNFSAINNFAAGKAKGSHLVLLNNDTEVISPGWLEAMLEHSQQPTVGAVGAKLYYDNDTIQHAGIVIGIGNTAGHLFKLLPAKATGYFNLANLAHEVSAVTAACLMIKKELYEEVNGLNETDFAVAFNDVDFCLRLQAKGYRNIFTPFCELYHYESISRGYEDTPEKLARFNKEADHLRQKYKHLFTDGDPYYTPNVSLDNALYEI